MSAGTAPTLDVVKIGIVSVSDRASGGVYIDKGLPALKDWLTRAVDRKSTRLNSSHRNTSRMPSSA